MEIYTIGHSTHNISEFISILNKYNIKILIDVRSYPGSNYVPQFNKKELEKSLKKQKIKYIHINELGGRRKKPKEIDESLINGWKVAAFKNYAGYTFTNKYEEGINRLIDLSKNEKTCIMCAEAVPWRCHRLIISNTLTFKGIDVFHIMNENKIIQHEVGMYGAKTFIKEDKLTYPKNV